MQTIVNQKLHFGFSSRSINFILVMSILMSFLAIPGAVSNALSGVFYVSPAGSDANPGTLALPWRSVGASVQKLSAGSTLYVRGGTYHETVYVSASGTSSTPILISGYPGETASIDGQGNIPSGYWDVLFNVNGSYVTVSNLEVKNSYGMGLVFTGSNNRATQIHAHHNMENGILIKGNYNIVENSEVNLNCLSNQNGTMSRGSWASGLTAARRPTNAIMRNNKVHDNWGEGLSTYEATGTLMEGNVVYDNYSTNIYISDATNVKVQRNLVYGTAAPIVNSGSRVGIMMGDEKYNPPSSNISVINNMVVGTYRNFYWWQGTQGGGMSNVLIAGNTFVNSRGTTDVQISRGTHTNVRYINNIAQQDDGLSVALVPSISGLTFSNNLWSKTPPSIVTGSGDVIANPLLAKTGSITPGLLTADYFKFQSTSPAINRAKALVEVTVDYFNSSRGTTPDIGGYEYAGPVSVPSTATSVPTSVPTSAPITVPTLAPTQAATSTKIATPVATSTLIPGVANTPVSTATKAPTLSATATPVQITTTLQDTSTSSGNATVYADTFLSQSSPSANYGKRTTFKFGSDGSNGSGQGLAGLTRWDLASIPAGKTVNSASIVISLIITSGQTYQVYQVLRPWNENQATWLKATDAVKWQALGASGAQDRGSVSLGSLTPLANGMYTIKLNPAGEQVVQGWVNRTTPNNGFIIVGNSTAMSVIVKSNEYSSKSLRPKLVINTNK